MNHLSLFSGVGGMDLGFERAGMTTIGQVEIDPVCRDVLGRHWPNVPRHDDVRSAAAWWWTQPNATRTVDVVSGGMPCQPFSVAGTKKGTTDDRWLWPAFFDVVRSVRPRYVVLENVAQLTKSTAFGLILADLARARFHAQWSVLPACAVGAPHLRRRLFIVAYPDVLDGRARMGPGHHDQTPLRLRSGGEYAWGDDRVWLQAARASYRVVDRSARRLVARGGNAVVPAVAELVGRLIMAHNAGANPWHDTDAPAALAKNPS